MLLWKLERSLLSKRPKAFGFSCVTCELPILCTNNQHWNCAIIRKETEIPIKSCGLNSPIYCKETMLLSLCKSKDLSVGEPGSPLELESIIESYNVLGWKEL